MAGVDIRLEAPAGCPSAAGVAAKLETAIEGAALTPTSVHIRITADRGKYRLELVIGGDRERSRTLDGAWCEAVVDAAVLILSLALLPKSAPEEPETAFEPGEPGDQAADAELPAVPPEPPPPPAGFEEDPPEVTAPASPPPVPISMSLGAAAALDGGTLPGVAPGVGVAATARRAGLSLDLSAAYFPTHREVVEMGQGAAISATAINLRGCRATGPMWLCIGGEMNLLDGSGVGLAAAEDSRFFLWGFTGAARYQRRLGERLVMAATAEIVGHPARPAYFIDNPRRLIHRPGWLSARLWLVGQVVIF